MEYMYKQLAKGKSKKTSTTEGIVYVGSEYDDTTSSIDVKYLKPENSYILQCENRIAKWFRKNKIDDSYTQI
jgi:hypothetical protein